MRIPDFKKSGLLGCLLLAGCVISEKSVYNTNYEDGYKKSRNGSPSQLQVPLKDKINHDYVLPDVEVEKEPVSIIPPP